MDEKQIIKGTLQIILFIVLSAVTAHFIYQSFVFVKSAAVVIRKSGFEIYAKFPMKLISNIFKYVLCTLFTVYLTINQAFIAFTDKKPGIVLPVISTSVTLVLMAASEVLDFYSYKGLLGSYKAVTFLSSYLSVAGIINVLIFLFMIYYLVNLVVQSRAEAKS